ncbi:metal ABC transporter solute-binding protein, Zn/Mn family [Clostridium vincentii]|uniref:High-affinity zinc uptake system binding-protein ZnuA n=1 Tax=Clostridium vincentii TaxID=52704 RepID=A0A2T0BB25_9CLOT|nr:zinc ABC transporter substrate-binding protein [Clostridium vincentii]PRR81033.1 High-affinity zinc uptake system binding-protein ZnuA precursor [Clostridium vincentii]
MLKIGRSLAMFSIIVPVLFFSACGVDKEGNSLNESEKISVAVSIVPQETFVKAVGGDKVDIITMIPPGKSPENFAPTPEVMEKLSSASLYFSIGVPTESASILPKIGDFNKDIKIVNMAETVSEVYSEIKFESGERDPHIWLSPKRVKIMIQEIVKELSEKDPSNTSFYETNGDNYINELDKLDTDIKSSLVSLEKNAFICYHPAFGYFADDYGLEMVALEQEGKEATVEDFQKTIDFAKKEKIQAIFYQAEIDSKQSETFASEISGKAEMVEPLSSDYISNLDKMAKTFKETMELD